MRHSKKLAKSSFNKTPYECKHSWPEACHVQCGSSGLVIVNKKLDDVLSDPKESQDILGQLASGNVSGENYRTAFFEAFPKNPLCFVRGEGGSIEQAEEDCWNQYQKIASCKAHEFERVAGRSDGYARCISCGLQQMALPPSTLCVVCNTPAHFHRDVKGAMYCEAHFFALSPEAATVEDGTVFSQRCWFNRGKAIFDFLCLKDFSPFSEDQRRLIKDNLNSWVFHEYRLQAKTPEEKEKCLSKNNLDKHLNSLIELMKEKGLLK